MGIEGKKTSGTARLPRALEALLVLVMIAGACSSSGDNDAGEAATPTPAGPDDSGSEEDVQVAASGPAGSRTIRLSEGSPDDEADAVDPVPVVAGEPLDQATVASILERLPAWTPDPDDQVDFNRPPDTLPPPRPGETIESTFPATLDTDPPDEVPSGPLEVLRFQPEGDVAIAPTVSVTFNQPMVPLATLDQSDELPVPVIMSPETPGRWEWIGTRTIRFEHESDLIDRLPMATAYTVEVPAGTRSEAGGTLAEAVSFEFTTPTVQVQRLTPTADDGGVDLEPVFVAHFDQRIDPTALLETISVEAEGSSRAIRLATDEEIEADERASREVSNAIEGRWIAFRATEAFEPDTVIDLRVGPGVPSAEGPRTSDDAEAFTAQTYQSLEVTWQNCRDDDECQPFSGLFIEMNNALDPDAFDPSAIVIEPELPGAVINASGATISIQAATAGRTTYEVSLPASLTDVWGQTLGEPRTLEFEIGPAWPALLPFPSDFITADPYADPPTVPVTSINHDRLRVEAFAVTPRDWLTYTDAQWQIDDEDYELPNWDRVLETTVDVDSADDELTETAVDLSDALDGDHGQLVVLVRPDEEYDRDDELYWANRPTLAWVQVTDIGLDAFADNTQMVAWTTDLATGAPLDGVEIDIVGSGITMTTDADGIAAAELTGRRSDLVTATTDDDLALLPNWTLEREATRDAVRWYVIDDRAMYRPGETVSVKGWVRKLTLSEDAQLAPIAEDARVNWFVIGPQGNELATGTADVNTLGGFDLTVDLPSEANLGRASIELDLVGDSGDSARHSHMFEIQEFRRPEFEVATRAETPGPYLQTEPATVAVDANYFSGGPLPNADVEWRVTTRETTYSPPDWPDFTFGIWQPWWYEPFFGGYDEGGSGAADHAIEEEFAVEEGFADYEEPPIFPGSDPGEVETFTGVTDADGAHYLQIGFEGDETDLPSTVDAAATVFDVNRQAWGSSTSLLVHAADLYVGLRSDRSFVRQGDPMVISTIVTDIDGMAIPDRELTVEANLLEWRTVKGEWQQVVAETEACSVTTGTDPVTCTFATTRGGEYQIVSTVVDDEGRHNRSELTFWVSGGKQRPNRRLEQEALTLVPDKDEYAPGDTAELLVQAPFDEGEGLLTITRSGIQATERFQLVESAAVLEVAIEDFQIPNVHVQVDVVGASERVADDGAPLADAPPRPAFATGALSLPIPPLSRTLDVDVEPAAEKVEPGADTSVTVTVEDQSGVPVADAELAVIVVDEAVLALTDYELTDPISTFYASIPSQLRSQYLRNSVLLENPLLLSGDEAARSATAGADDAVAESVEEEAADFAAEAPAADGGQGGAARPIGVRSDFDALAVFEPEVTTDVAGQATVAVPLPDNLTRYRIMVVAVDGVDRFGSGESNLTARLPLQVRPSPPRFLNFGDEFEFPVVVQNQTDATMDVDVVVQTGNLTVTDREGTRVTVPANDRVEVRFPMAAEEAGTARFRVAAASAESADAATDALPVYTPATTEAFATYGVVDDQGSVLQPLLAPEDVWPQFGGLEIGTSSTALQALTDAVIYIADYPYRSADAHGSRILAIAALRDVLEAFDAEGLPSASDLIATVQADLDAIASLQNDDGGFPIWRRWEPSWSYHSVHVAHALVEARNNGYDVPLGTLDLALGYLATIEDRFYPDEMSQETRDAISAYALSVRNLSGDRDTTKAEALYRRSGDDLSLEALAWIWPIVDDPAIEAEIERTFANRATETAGAATFATDYGDDAYVLLHSSRRTDGVILDALIEEQPTSDLIPKVVAGLLGNQTKGRWDNMQENTFILLALNKYFDTFEAEDPDFVARVWLGDTYAAEHEYRGRSTARNDTLVPMAVLVEEDGGDLLVAKDGAAGRLYYRLGLRYAPSSLELEPRDRGFVVSRTYEALDDPGDVVLDDDGVWRIAAGADVRVRLTMVADSRRTHVALVDPLPAGLEPQNPALAVTPELPPDDGSSFDTYWYWQWFGHQNLRDDRAEAFTSLLQAGVYEYSYVTRATTPGRFVTPPTRAEEMYAPEVFGRSATDTVIIE